MNVYEFFSANPKAWWAIGILFMLLVARGPTLRFFKWRMEKKAAELEMSTYGILRKSIADLSLMYDNAEKKSRAYYQRIEELEKEVEELKAYIKKNINV